ncbi:MAG: tRNA (adenosine(37)-N6)-threonylcarbamoyltransferase complex dimerization subunit type 1 TsaB [Synergistaceae bacterium]|nr:tRNA (adenosine(37)-N6)-threonylcarbamoyltransferase complex dimerization subunit type 1 TsaB [Synergistaceae bacterium]
MSVILSVDCCLRLTGAALMVDGEITASEQGDLGRRQSQELPLMTERLLARSNLAWDFLDYVALTNGPGYFTGIRVGAAYASGVAYASGAKVIPVSSLELLAASSGQAGRVKVLAVVYAGHGFVYASCEGFLEAGEYTLDEIHEWLTKNPDAVIISDDPQRTALQGVQILTVKPDVRTLCELAKNRTQFAISPMELKISYFRAPQGVN